MKERNNEQLATQVKQLKIALRDIARLYKLSFEVKPVERVPVSRFLEIPESVKNEVKDRRDLYMKVLEERDRLRSELKEMVRENQPRVRL